MMLRKGVFAVAALFVLGMVVPLQADQPAMSPRDEMSKDEAGATPTGEFYMADKLMGMDVVDAQGNKLGEVEDAVLDPGLERVNYVVLAYGEVMGLGGKYFAVPCDALEVRPDSDKITLNISKEKLDAAPGFDKDKWPTEPDPMFSDLRKTEAKDEFKDSDEAKPSDEMKDTYSDIKEESKEAAEAAKDKLTKDEMAGREETIPFEYQKISTLLGLNVRGTEDADLGEIENIVVNVTGDNRAHLAYGIVGYGGVLGVGEKLSPVPWTSIAIVPERDMARVNATREKLDTLAFKADEPPNFSDQEYASRVDQTYEKEPSRVVYGMPREEGQTGDPTATWKPDSEYNKLYSKDQEQTVTGKIVSMGTFRPEPGALPGNRLRVQTDEGIMIVHAGPQKYAMDQQMRFHAGNEVTVTGAKATFKEHSVLIAREIKVGDKTLTLRDENGTPQWKIEELTGEGMEEATTPPEEPAQ